MAEKHPHERDPNASENADAPDDERAAEDAPSEERASEEIPDTLVDEAERLTRLADEAAVEAAADAYLDRRDELVDDHGFTARVRDEDDTLVLYPDEWVDDGVVQFDRIEDTDRAVEVSLSGPDFGADWEAVEAANQAVIDEVETQYGVDHAANVRAFADFMGNHYLKRVVDATADERSEFLTEYYPRNVWPSKNQSSIVTESLELLEDVGDEVAES